MVICVGNDVGLAAQGNKYGGCALQHVIHTFFVHIPQTTSTPEDHCYYTAKTFEIQGHKSTTGPQIQEPSFWNIRLMSASLRNVQGSLQFPLYTPEPSLESRSC